MGPAAAQTNMDAAYLPVGLEWATTEYLYDITQEYYQVIAETITGKNGNNGTTYANGLSQPVR